jgi:hypothetical protein
MKALPLGYSVSLQLVTIGEQVSHIHPAKCKLLILRVVGRSPAAEGWEAVATEGDEAVEMTENRRVR